MGSDLDATDTRALAEFLQTGLGIRLPAKNQTLGKAGAAQFPLALDKSAFTAYSIGIFNQQLLEYLAELRYCCQKGILMQCCLGTTIVSENALFVLS